ncbi:MAG: hypothetical protein JKY27_13850 [Magnetovibrio sp.]|nr:hypothetical protein [Magnetovibrio sp.]
MEAIGQLTGGVAHDFNNLLTIILNNLTSLRTHCASDPELEEFIKSAFDAANNGSNLIKRLLGRTFPSSIEIMTQVKGTPRPTLVDRSRLENAILNLAFNARDAMNGEGRLLFSIGETYLNRSAANALGIIPGNYIRVNVEDTGSGMSEETQHRAFEPFFTTKNHGVGHGLELSTVYGFVQKSAGGIEITSSSPAGTCLSLYLPCTDMVPQSAGDYAEDISHHSDAGGTGELVLLVVDDPGMRDIVRRQLVSLGHSVLEACGLDDTLALVRSVSDIHFLVSDVVEVRTICNIRYLVTDGAQPPHQNENSECDRKAIKISQTYGFDDGLSCQNFADYLSFTVQETDGFNETIHMRLS